MIILLNYNNHNLINTSTWIILSEQQATSSLKDGVVEPHQPATNAVHSHPNRVCGSATRTKPLILHVQVLPPRWNWKTLAPETVSQLLTQPENDAFQLLSASNKDAGSGSQYLRESLRRPSDLKLCAEVKVNKVSPRGASRLNHVDELMVPTTCIRRGLAYHGVVPPVSEKHCHVLMEQRCVLLPQNRKLLNSLRNMRDK
ncbi:hypothetical protein V8G54_022112 [Vigna mungo]|uniref:Uncharacterized protein n=1 Tax=Vigna mungo TaxID=3915 RepID=A0AAQ3NGV8_VIGMU